MDATLSLGLPRLNQSGTLLEGIALWGELKPLLTPEAVVERALRYCDWRSRKGLLAIRSHVDICDDRLARGRCAARREAEGRALHRPAARRLSAGRLLPLARRGDEPRARARQGRRRRRRHSAFRAHDGRRRALDARCCATSRPSAACMVDMHCDETDDPLSRHIETLACETQRLGLHGPRHRLAPHLDALHGQLLRLASCCR